MGILLSATKLLEVSVKGIELVAWLEELASLDEAFEEELDELLEELFEDELLDEEELLDDDGASLLFELDEEEGVWSGKDLLPPPPPPHPSKTNVAKNNGIKSFFMAQTSIFIAGELRLEVWGLYGVIFDKRWPTIFCQRIW